MVYLYKHTVWYYSSIIRGDAMVLSMSIAMVKETRLAQRKIHRRMPDATANMLFGGIELPSLSVETVSGPLGMSGRTPDTVLFGHKRALAPRTGANTKREPLETGLLPMPLTAKPTFFFFLFRFSVRRL